jgi:hypothetical protein
MKATSAIGARLASARVGTDHLPPGERKVVANRYALSPNDSGERALLALTRARTQVAFACWISLTLGLVACDGDPAPHDQSASSSTPAGSEQDTCCEAKEGTSDQAPARSDAEPTSEPESTPDSDPAAASDAGPDEAQRAADSDACAKACEPPRASDPAAVNADGSSSANDAQPDAGAAPASPDASVNADAGVAVDTCWHLPVIDRVRLYPAPGKAALLAQGRVEGSNTSAMNGFVELARVTTAAPEAQWLELGVSNPAAYRYVKWHGPSGSYGAIAEFELYAGAQRVSGLGFGTAGARAGADTTFARALDGDTQTFFEGPLADDQYVGLDLASAHVAASPTFSADAASSTSQTVRITAATGAQVLYSTDGSDPRTAGKPYAGAITLGAGSTLLRAVATEPCKESSEISQALYPIGAQSRAAQSSMHVGNSLTDTVVPYLQTLAQSGGITLDFNRYTVPGAGTWEYVEMPTGGFGVPNIQEALRTRPFDHLSLQAYPNMPCQALPSADGTDSDSGYMNQMWSDARTQNPNVQLWVYHQWPTPHDYSNCLSGGGWTRGGWAPPAPMSWEEAVANELSYHETVRAELVRLNPTAPTPYIIPAGNALVLLKRQVEAGAVPGLSDFFTQIFLENGTDIHLTPIGAYYVTLVFYGCMFQKTPEGTVPDPSVGVSAQQASVLQRLSWQAVTAYPLSGVLR